MENKVFEEIKNAADIVEVVSEYVELQKKGRNHWGLCPFHDDINPSMSVSADKQMYNCFSCGHAGGVFKFVQSIKNISFIEAAKLLADKYNVKFDVTTKKHEYRDDHKQMINAMNETMDFFRVSIDSEVGVSAKEYAEERGLDSSIRERFSIGYAPVKGTKDYLVGTREIDESLLINCSVLNDSGYEFFKDRLIFGITNELGDVVAFSGRTLNNDKAKYINSRETRVFDKSSILYNYKNALESVRKHNEIVIVEGFMDVIAMYKAGIENVVALMGTALTEKHIRNFKNNTVILMLDGDVAGKNATVKSIKTLVEHKVAVKVVNNVSKKDPDELLKESKEKLIEVFNSRMSGFEFVYRLHKEKFKKTPSDIEALIKSMEKYMVHSSEIERDFFAKRVNEDYDVSKEIVMKMWNANVSNDVHYSNNPVSEYKEYNNAPSNYNDNYSNDVNSYVQPEPEYHQDASVPSINWNANSYKLIRTLLRSKNLAKYYENLQKKPRFVNKEIWVISRYVCDAHNGKVPPQRILDYIKENIGLEGEFVKTEAEFDTLIKLINANYKTHMKIETKRKYKESTQELKVG